VLVPQPVPVSVGLPEPTPVELTEELGLSEPLPLPIELPLNDSVEDAETLAEPLVEGKEGLANPLGLTDPDKLGDELRIELAVCMTDSDLRPVPLIV